VIDVVDLERQEIIQLVQDMPDSESRFIGVINKCDTKQKKSNDWVSSLSSHTVCDLIISRFSTSSATIHRSLKYT
jgi:hypothetical protein